MGWVGCTAGSSTGASTLSKQQMTDKQQLKQVVTALSTHQLLMNCRRKHLHTAHSCPAEVLARCMLDSLVSTHQPKPVRNEEIITNVLDNKTAASCA
jgi:hypothetical protein